MGSAKRCCATGLEIMFRGMASGARSAASPRGYISRKFNVTSIPHAATILSPLQRIVHSLGTCRTTDRRPLLRDCMILPMAIVFPALPYTLSLAPLHDMPSRATRFARRLKVYFSLHLSAADRGPLLMTLRRYLPPGHRVPCSTHYVDSQPRLTTLKRRTHLRREITPAPCLLDLAVPSIPRSTNDTPPLRHQLSPQPGWSSQRDGHVGTFDST
ncbi:hypothetical protein Hypma_004062 [Hypsizygus marmoreus]|uniref:Uncharacterized protein n=1 Tax=Hypsizygus marmoreus TaxID=39966 RepID=A0A369J0S8_HYPMA|nr:hypothetical protein Hypma_004062 [Hypsizygus marmoreus]